MTVDRALELLELRTKRAISFLPEKQRLYFEKLKER